MLFLIKSIFKLGLLLVAVLILVGLGYWLLLPDASPLPPFPQLPGYTVVEGEAASTYISELESSDSGGLVTGIADMGQVAQCYQDIGGARVQLYRHQEEVLKMGAVAMVSQNTMANPTNLINCIAASQEAPATDSVQIQTIRVSPCQADYTLAKDEDTIHIVYVASSEEVCQAFCSQLEGCTAHRP